MSHLTHPRRRLLAHPATLALSVAGSSTADLAEALGVSRGAVSQYLAGTLRPHVDMADVLPSLVGGKAATEIMALIPERTPTA